ncbi:alpha/beta hydrolase [Sphingomonas radiodurans]|uniref:alpha/beta hydrolase n=1 Tax=Sphingomonas radiodurans TaxID=2890321 RepID=UPI001E65D0EC|nr:alpha/beta fold hydrolase [Sphingomonas radiodurans]WBH18024.1 alpha/beta fold hydrolase [Sphingomonas radiodurans]
MTITRHFVDVGTRRVHYRRAGAGPVLLMVHQSPRSSAEYAPLMRDWSRHFTCIAPDSPGFGQSDPFADLDASIEAFADGLVAFLDALGIDRVAAYGFHSGGIILVNALKRHPSRFTALAIGGYAIWTPEERRIFSDGYLPPFRPQPYGEHLTWAWNRVLEQTWFFPWFAVEPATRMSVAHDDPVRVDATIRDLLDSGDAYRTGYGAVLRAARDIPAPGEPTAPVLITASTGDPLQDHIDRLGTLPPQWSACKVATPDEHQQVSVTYLAQFALAGPDRLGEAADEGFFRISVPGYDGLIHWRGSRGAPLTIHGPGRGLELLPEAALAIDLPGHGLSDPWPGEPPVDAASWTRVIEAAAEVLDARDVVYEAMPVGDPDRLFPDFQPDRFGAYLTRAWGIVRAGHLFSPWYEAKAENAIAFAPADLAPDQLAIEHRALIRSSAAREWLIARRQQEE